jgi:hypothetical protein
MFSIDGIIARNKSTKADIEGASFQIVDGVRVPIFTGVAGEHIDSISLADLQREDALDEACDCDWCREDANPADGGYDEDEDQ